MFYMFFDLILAGRTPNEPLSSISGAPTHCLESPSRSLDASFGFLLRNIDVKSAGIGLLGYKLKVCWYRMGMKLGIKPWKLDLKGPE